MSENIITEVRNALDHWLEAFNNNDIEALMALYDPEIVYANSNKPIEIGIPVVKEGFIGSFVLNQKCSLKKNRPLP